MGRFGRNQSPFRRRCILGKFLGVVCHCFSPCLDVPTFPARCLHVLKDARDPSSERCEFGREKSGNFAYMTSQFKSLGIFYMPQIYDMGPTALLPLRRKAEDFFRPFASPGFEPANLGTKGQHPTPRPPKPLLPHVTSKYQQLNLLTYSMEQSP
jgi:hypothetical protein